jgi:hypothetical protein
MRLRFWKWLHEIVNRQAHRHAKPHYPLVGYERHWLWRLNNWLADRWIPEWMGRKP